ncbi:alpha/beta fold hydrolase [Quadrisphaera setariae]|uniref:Alpha/beta fold hydrolase n=1 Tax=Quadrisphaera setariae TaxID=2593304 RepID=A0A5C8ZFD4_9ACTN|nr:alpha/beta fold hydrolase [Quadrisphaera setariae]
MRDRLVTRAPAALPPAGLPGLDPTWSRLVSFTDADGVRRTVHLLDGEAAVREATGADPVGVLLAVHGNPTWSYLWRSLLPRAAAAGWRLVAPDQLDMGWSERTGTRRRLERRIDDLGRLTDVLGVSGPVTEGSRPRVVTIGHDWGGVVSSGWAGRHRDVLEGVVLLNTAVHQPEGASLPAILVPFTTHGLHTAGTTTTDAFMRATVATARRPLAPGVADAYLAPYRGAARRVGVGAFVADIPVTPGHPSAPTLDEVAAGLSAIGADRVPSLLVWGPADPVFRQRYFQDLRARLPHADVHRFEGTGHLLVEDVEPDRGVAGTVVRWLERLRSAPYAGAARTTGSSDPSAAQERAPLWSALRERSQDDSVAVAQLRPGAPAETLTWRQLAARVEDLAEGLAASGVRPGQRVALLVPPGPDLSALFSACLRLGAVVVVADAGLGVKGLTRAVASADPAVVIGIERALLAARALGWPGRRVLAGASTGIRRRALGAVEHLADLEAVGRARRTTTGHQPLPEPSPSDQGAVLFTSGSTGPAKGVVHTHATLQALRDAAAQTCGLGPGGSLVAAFAPFAILAPLLGATAAVPETDVTKPDTLTAAALARAVAAVAPDDESVAPVVFASPAALRRVVATSGDVDDAGRAALARVRLLLSAGAPVGTDLLAQAGDVLPGAECRTPYGMTEGLLVAQTNLTELQAAGPGEGVLVGSPLPGTRLATSALDDLGRAVGPLVEGAEAPTGEIVVRSPLMKDHYDQLWDVQRESVRGTPGAEGESGWHRTGDVGHLDAAGRLWVEGRLAHVVTTAAGPLTPVGAEQRVQLLPGVARAALVGVGPAGTQQPVVVLETTGGNGAPVPGPAPVELVDAVRATAGTPVPVAAVLVVSELPTDVRHRSKVDRTRVAAWAAGVLSGSTKADSPVEVPA